MRAGESSRQQKSGITSSEDDTGGGCKGTDGHPEREWFRWALQGIAGK